MSGWSGREPVEWLAIAGLVTVSLLLDWLAVRRGWFKPRSEINPGWSYLRSTLSGVVVTGVGLAIYYGLFDRG